VPVAGDPPVACPAVVGAGTVGQVAKPPASPRQVLLATRVGRLRRRTLPVPRRAGATVGDLTTARRALAVHWPAPTGTKPRGVPSTPPVWPRPRVTIG